jgi:hypothetical protein
MRITLEAEEAERDGLTSGFAGVWHGPAWRAYLDSNLGVISAVHAPILYIDARHNGVVPSDMCFRGYQCLNTVVQPKSYAIPTTRPNARFHDNYNRLAGSTS